MKLFYLHNISTIAQIGRDEVHGNSSSLVTTLVVVLAARVVNGIQVYRNNISYDISSDTTVFLRRKSMWILIYIIPV